VQATFRLSHRNDSELGPAPRRPLTGVRSATLQLSGRGSAVRLAWALRFSLPKVRRLELKPLVLVAAADLVAATMYEAVLTTRGFEVVTVCDGFDAIDVALSRRPSLVVLERMVPGLDAIALCRVLKARRATDRIPILVLTTTDETPEDEAIIEAGADQVMTEPSGPSLLALEAKRLVDERRTIVHRDRSTPRRRASDTRRVLTRTS
jgi:CheY-like chemotaxis protein